jgi:hypothetical protein
MVVGNGGDIFVPIGNHVAVCIINIIIAADITILEAFFCVPQTGASVVRGNLRSSLVPHFTKPFFKSKLLR